MKLLVLLVASALLLGCTGAPATKISDVKTDPEKYLGEKITLRGTVKESVKLGELSVFTLDDGTGTFAVSSELIPPAGRNATVTGTVMSQNIFMSTHYYLLAKDVRLD